MRAPQRIEPKKIQEVASLLIPLQGQSILLPNVTVAEIIPVSQVQPVENAPAWYLGNFQWRELTVPLLSLESLNGDAVPQIHNRARFAVLNTTGLHGDLAFIALLTQGLPRLARVSEDEISEREDAENRAYDLMHVSWAGEYTLIPDVTAIEQKFLDYLHSHEEVPAATLTDSATDNTYELDEDSASLEKQPDENPIDFDGETEIDELSPHAFDESLTQEEFVDQESNPAADWQPDDYVTDEYPDEDRE